MKYLNFGSLNCDFVYAVPWSVRPGETLAATKRDTFCGGKGLNQSLALARAGADVYHAGCIGSDGSMLREILEQSGANTSFVRELNCPSGHAIIQVDEAGQNSILLFGGANQKIDRAMVDEVLDNFDCGDRIILQNEISEIPYLISRASERGLQVVWNPSPFPQNVQDFPLDKVDCFVVNEIEGAQLTGATEPDAILDAFKLRFPNKQILLTLGKDGAVYFDGMVKINVPCVDVPVVDTTGAGDTFLGYFFAYFDMIGPAESLKIASAAAAIAVSRAGAASSIPYADEVSAFIKSGILPNKI